MCAYSGNYSDDPGGGLPIQGSDRRQPGSRQELPLCSVLRGLVRRHVPPNHRSRLPLQDAAGRREVLQVANLGHSRAVAVPHHNQRLLPRYLLVETGSQVVLIVYDLTDESSFKEVEEYWIQEVRNNSDSEVLVCLVGNKCDMPATAMQVT